MSSLPNSLKNISLFLERLPGIGEKTANRLAFFLLNLPEEDLKEFAENVSDLKLKTKLCKNCFNFTENEVCEICENSERDHSIICVVETVLDLLSFEQGRIYNGVYHVLHGKIDPLNRVGPDDIKIKELLERVNRLTSSRVNELKEIVLATNPNMEGEATAVYIKNKLKTITDNGLRITRLAYGLPMGANLEYADYMTLKKAIEGRNRF
ncbi:MAG: recombination mediator RecR [Patescibacteria group bacterium]